MKKSCLHLILLAAALLPALPGRSQDKPFLEDLSYYIENTAVFEKNQLEGRAYWIPGTSLSLNGRWNFLYADCPGDVPKDFFAPGFNTRKWTEIDVPSNWEMQGFGQPLFRNTVTPFPADPPHVPLDVNPTGAYRREFTLPSSWSGQEIFLRFEKVASASFVWVNGREVGYNEGAQEPAEYDITEYVKPGKNTVSVLVLKYSDGCYLECQDYWRLAGIFDDVWVYASPKQRIWDWYAVTDLDKDFRDARLTVDVDLRSFGPAAGGLQVAAELSKDGARVARMDAAPAALPDRGRTSVRLAADVRAPRKWTAETPELYDLTLTLNDASGRQIDRIDTRIGFKETEIRDGVFYLNGQTVKVNAINSHMQHPDLGHTMDEETIRRDFEILKQFNFNGVRTSHYPPVNRYLQLADEYGLYIVDETGDEAHATEFLSDRPEWEAMYRERARRLVLRDRNHACVLFWSAGNESGEGPNIAAVIDEGRKYDHTRYWMYGGNAEKNPAEEILGPRYALPIDHEVLYGLDTQDMRPSFMDEYLSVAGNGGGGAAEYWRVVWRHPKLMGGALWDFVSPGLTEYERILRDGSPYGTQASIMGRATLESGPTGKCLDLKVTDQWVEVYRADNLEISSDKLTLVIDVFPRSHNAAGGYFLTKGSNQFGLRQLGADKLVFYLDTGKKEQIEGALPADWTDRWHRISAVYDGAQMRLFIDGAQVASGEAKGKIRNLPWPVNIGRDGEAHGQDTRVYICDARIDNVGIFTDALLPGDGYAPEKSVLWLDFESEQRGGKYFSHGIGARTYGAIWPDRTPQPELWEFKKSTQPLDFDFVNPAEGCISVWNRQFFSDASAYRTSWTLTCDEQVIDSGELDLAGLGPWSRTVKQIPLRRPAQPVPGAEYRLNITSVLREATQWAPAGFEISWEQFELKDWNVPAAPRTPVSGPLTLSRQDGVYRIEGQGFRYGFDAASGALCSMQVDGAEMLTSPLRLNVWRAPVANELDGWNAMAVRNTRLTQGFGRWLVSMYYSYGLDNLAFLPVEVKAEKVGDAVVVDVRELVLLGGGAAELSQMDLYIFGSSCKGFECSYRYTVTPDGVVQVDHFVNPQGGMPLWLPRIGVTMGLDASLSHVAWYGRGPQANYPDRKTGYRVGIYEDSVEDMYEPYLIPQDFGLRTDNRWVCLTDGNGKGLKFSCDELFNFNVYEYDTDNLTKANYQYQIHKADDLTFNLDYATSGVGCSAKAIFNAYRAYPTGYTRTVRIAPVR